MFYTAETGRQHATTFFNRTIDVVEPHTWVDFQAIFLVVLILAGIGGLGMLPQSMFATELFQQESANYHAFTRTADMLSNLRQSSSLEKEADRRPPGSSNREEGVVPRAVLAGRTVLPKALEDSAAHNADCGLTLMPTQAYGSGSRTLCRRRLYAHRCGLACAGYLAYLGLVQSGWVKPRKAGRMTRKVETKKKEVNSDEWLKGTYYNQVVLSSSSILNYNEMQLPGSAPQHPTDQPAGVSGH